MRIAERATWNVRFGQLPTFDRTRGISTLPSEADIGAIFRDVSFGPKAEVLALRGHVRFTPQKQTSEPFSVTSALAKKAPFASVFAISDPTARALPDEEAQFHSAEGRLKTLIQRQQTIPVTPS